MYLDSLFDSTGEDAQAACAMLVDAVLESGRCSDNVTAILVLLDRAASSPPG